MQVHQATRPACPPASADIDSSVWTVAVDVRHIEDMMSTPPNPGWFTPDSRANRLHSWTTTPHEGGHVLWLRGPDGIASQICKVAPHYRAEWMGVASGWTHALFSPEPGPNAKVRHALDVLTEILTLQRCPRLDFAIALDWYKIPDENIDPYDWLNTPNGELVYRGKYRYKNDRQQQDSVGMQLVGNMVDIFDRHAALARATIVLDVPGHDGTRLSFGSRLATTVAGARGMTMVRVNTRLQFRPEVKNLTGAERAAILRDEFYLTTDLSGKQVVIIDDVYKSGTSMGAVADAARAAGALTVVGFAAVRTRSS
jgi:Phosphoribosyl transferase domain